MNIRHRVLHSNILLALAFAAPACVAGLQSYEVEEINDRGLLTFPNPEPVRAVTTGFVAKKSGERHDVVVDSTNLRNLSVTLRNLGDDVIVNPYLIGPQGYDFRSIDRLAPSIVAGATTDEEKFFRIHEWFAYHYTRFELGSGIAGYRRANNLGNAGRLINQFGGSMCGEAVEAMGGLLYQVPPVGSIFARKVQLFGHQTGEVYLNGAWRAFDASVDTRWVYYEADNKTMGPTFQAMKQDGGDLLSRIYPWSGPKIKERVRKGSGEVFPPITVQGDLLEFKYNLRPTESVRMDFTMQGKVDRKRVDPGGTWFGDDKRNPVDYGSATFTYRPDFRTQLHRPFAVEEKNVKWTKEGLVPVDTDEPAWIVFPATTMWSFVGANITANFKTEGKVLIGRKEDVQDTEYSWFGLGWIDFGVNWTELSGDRKEYGEGTIEGLSSYWVKFEFQGEGSGLVDAQIASEIMMNPLSMPGLQHGKNRFEFLADRMGDSTLEVTFDYDELAQYEHYEPATEAYGRHIRYRVGGNQYLPWEKYKFYENIKAAPAGSTQVTVEIFDVAGPRAGAKVRTLKSGDMPFGMHTWYWDGRGDAGERLPPGMYGFLVSEGGEQWGTSLYLFDGIWPVPNEIRHVNSN